MNAEIICVGSELLLGNVVNTDARDVSVVLSELGIDVYRHTVVGDNPNRLLAALREASERADIIITTGGLGPTCDDLTKKTVADFFSLPLYFDKEAEKRLLETIGNRHGGNMTENNLAQCWLPETCTPFYNTCGTAPGCGFRAGGKTVLILPGPPKELCAMLKLSGVPYLREVAGSPIYSRKIHIYGLGESFVEHLLRDKMESLTNPTLAPYARESEVWLRVSAKAPTASEADALMAPVIEEIKETLGDYIYGIDCDSLEKTVLGLLTEKGMTFSAAESCTGGLIAKRFTDLPGASAAFKGGVTVYTNEVKINIVGVPREVIEENGVVSAPVAYELAKRIRVLLGSDFGIGVTGLAGPDGDGVNEVGTVFVGFATKDETVVRKLTLGKRADRSLIRSVAASCAFDLLRRSLSGLPLQSEKSFDTGLFPKTDKA